MSAAGSLNTPLQALPPQGLQGGSFMVHIVDAAGVTIATVTKTEFNAASSVAESLIAAVNRDAAIREQIDRHLAERADA